MARLSGLICFALVLALVATAPAADLPLVYNGATQAPQPPGAKYAPPRDAKAQPPVIINYPSAALQAAPQAPRPPADGAAKTPTVINYPSAAGVKVAERVATAQAVPGRTAVAYRTYAEGLMTPAYYNAYAPLMGYAAPGYNMVGSMYSPYGLDYGFGFGGLGYGGLGYGAGYSGFAYTAPAAYPYAAVPGALVDLRPPRVEVLDTGVRPNAGHLTSFPTAAPVFGDVIVLYYR
jgi:hypothetical protein